MERCGWALLVVALGCGDAGGGTGGGTDAGRIDGGTSDASAGCAAAVDCDDGLYCNGEERCASGRCVAGTAIECDDGDDCTADACDEGTRGCTHGGADGDGDGHAAVGCGDGDDCDDSDAARHPGADEVCDGDDEDCDETTYGAADADADGAISAACCNASTCGPDCDDASMSVHPGATEDCNGIDDDCDAMVDDGATVVLYPDADGDLHGARVGAMMLCPDTPGYVPSNDDCDDAENIVHPGATELCNADDEDCDGAIDEGLLRLLYRDADGDSFGAMTGGMTRCPADGWVSDNTDCNDTAIGTHPAATERCSAEDEDCSGDGYNGLECAPGATRTCTACELTGGSQSCDAATCRYSAACTPPTTTPFSTFGATDPRLGHTCGGACDAGTHWCSDFGAPCTAGGVMQYGPYVGLPPGRYEARFEGYCLGGTPAVPCQADFDVYDYSRLAPIVALNDQRRTDGLWTVTVPSFEVTAAAGIPCHSIELRVAFDSGPRNIIYQTSYRRIGP